MVKNHVLSVVDRNYQIVYGQDSYYSCYFLKVFESDELVESYYVGKEILSKIYGKCINSTEMIHKMQTLGCERSEVIHMCRMYNKQKHLEIKKVVEQLEEV